MILVCIGQFSYFSKDMSVHHRTVRHRTLESGKPTTETRRGIHRGGTEARRRANQFWLHRDRMGLCRPLRAAEPIPRSLCGSPSKIATA